MVISQIAEKEAGPQQSILRLRRSGLGRGRGVSTVVEEGGEAGWTGVVTALEEEVGAGPRACPRLLGTRTGLG